MPEFLLGRMGLDVGTAAREGRIDPRLAAQIDETLSGMTAVAAGCERIKSTPIPFAYTLLLHRTATLFCFLLPFGLVDSIGYMTPVGGLGADPRIARLPQGAGTTV